MKINQDDVKYLALVQTLRDLNSFGFYPLSAIQGEKRNEVIDKIFETYRTNYELLDNRAKSLQLYE